MTLSPFKIIARIGDSCWRLWGYAEDRVFDWRNGIDTRGYILSRDIEVESEHRANAHNYQAVWCRDLRSLFKHARPLPIRFVDLGSGKGKSCFYAARSPFQSIVGVEFSHALVSIARQNLASFRGGVNIEFVQMDAAYYKLEPQRSLVFFGNSFDEIVLRRFLENNLDSFRIQKHLFGDFRDFDRRILEEMGFVCLWRDPRRALSIWQISS